MYVFYLFFQSFAHCYKWLIPHQSSLCPIIIVWCYSFSCAVTEISGQVIKNEYFLFYGHLKLIIKFWILPKDQPKWKKYVNCARMNTNNGWSIYSFETYFHGLFHPCLYKIARKSIAIIEIKKVFEKVAFFFFTKHASLLSSWMLRKKMILC